MGFELAAHSPQVTERTHRPSSIWAHLGAEFRVRAKHLAHPFESSPLLDSGCDAMKIQKRLLLISIGFVALGTPAQQNIPRGTIIPVRLNSSLSSQKSKAGQPIAARVAQDVPLPNGLKIREGAKITGRVIEVLPPSRGSLAHISFIFDHVVLGKQSLPVTTNLRALASFAEVDNAQIPARGMGESDAWSSRTTVQVGGDVVYWGGGPVESTMGPVGRPVDGATGPGVLVKITAKPGSLCHGEIGDHQGAQALWVFSSDACGVYGLSGTTIAHAGRTKPIGVIEVVSEGGQIKVPRGSALLLRVIGSQE